jgi:hypothetical protein
MTEHVGWLLDLYGHPDDGVVIWLLGMMESAIDLGKLRY